MGPDERQSCSPVSAVAQASHTQVRCLVVGDACLAWHANQGYWHGALLCLIQLAVPAADRSIQTGFSYFYVESGGNRINVTLASHLLTPADVSSVCDCTLGRSCRHMRVKCTSCCAKTRRFVLTLLNTVAALRETGEYMSQSSIRVMTAG